MTDKPIWSEEAITYLALADAAVTVTAVKHGLRPGESFITEAPTRWSKLASGRVGRIWLIVLAWMSPDLAEVEQTKLWLYAFEEEPETFDLDRDRTYGTAARGAEDLQALLDRLLERAAMTTLDGARSAFADAQARHNREQAPAVFIPPGTKGFTN